MSKELEQRHEFWVDPIEEIEEEPEVEFVEAVPTYTGRVVDCPKLNVRNAPDAKAQVVCVIDRDTEVEVDMSESTRYFYKIYLANGVEGFCMEQFIKIE